jgi:hypothetical protein
MDRDAFQERRRQIDRTLTPGIVAEPLLTAIRTGSDETLHRCIIEINTIFPGGLDEARDFARLRRQ